MLKCWRVRGLLAAAVYDDLDPHDSKRLHQHLDRCAACRKKLESFRGLSAFMQTGAPQLDAELLPLIKRELHKRPQPAGHGWTWAAAAASLFLIVALTYQVAPQLKTSLMAASMSPIQQRMNAADHLIGDRQYAAAYQSLQKAVSENPKDPEAGVALARMADIAFSKLSWYPEAYEAYDQLSRKYPEIYSSNPDIIVRHNCLLETLDQEFAPLYALDAARRSGPDQFTRLETILGRYPGTLVAAMAVEDMAQVAVDELASKDPSAVGDENVYLAALVCAKDRCSNPIAAAQLKLELAHTYVRDLNDSKMARTMLHEVVETGGVELAGLAQDGLATLDGAE